MSETYADRDEERPVLPAPRQADPQVAGVGDDGAPAAPAGGIDEVLAAESVIAAAIAGTGEPAEAAGEPAKPAEAADEPAKPVSRIKKTYRIVRELVRSVATAYVSAYISLVIWSLLPMALGWTPTIIVSGSMEPGISVGDVVFFAPEPVDKVVPGRVLLVKDPDSPGQLLSHRLYERKPDGTLILKGDANASPDTTPVRPENVLGAGRLVIPHVGKVTLWRDNNREDAMLWSAITVAALLLARGPGGSVPASRKPGRRRRDGSG
jgi:signal peptidase